MRTNSSVCELSLFLPRFESSLLAGPILCPICIHSQPIRAHETLYKKMQHKHFLFFHQYETGSEPTVCSRLWTAVYLPDLPGEGRRVCLRPARLRGTTRDLHRQVPLAVSRCSCLESHCSCLGPLRSASISCYVTIAICDEFSAHLLCRGLLSEL